MFHFPDVTLDDTATANVIRLVGAATPLEGRVEVFFFGQWGTVCNHWWDLADATVVCHQLGYLRAVGVPATATFGAGSGPSWYRSVDCAGTERNLTECSKLIYSDGRACSHSQDATAICSSKLKPSAAYTCLLLYSSFALYCCIICSD